MKKLMINYKSKFKIQIKNIMMKQKIKINKLKKLIIFLINMNKN